MRIRKIPDLEPEERIFGFQLVFKDYAIDIYFCFSIFKVSTYYFKNECWGLLLGFFRIEGTNLIIDF